MEQTYSLKSTCCPGFSCPEATSALCSMCSNLIHVVLGKKHFSSLSVLGYTATLPRSICYGMRGHTEFCTVQTKVAAFEIEI